MTPILFSSVLLLACGGDDTTRGTDTGSLGDSGAGSQDSGSVLDTQDSAVPGDSGDTVPPTDTTPQGPSLSELIDHGQDKFIHRITPSITFHDQVVGMTEQSKNRLILYHIPHSLLPNAVGSGRSAILPCLATHNVS